MKKIGKNTKLYLIGMIIGGITLGITTVIADTIINSTSVAYKTTTVKAALDELYDIADFKQEVKDMLYPVGSIYISVSSTNPSELFGGTWVSFGQGRTLLGTGSVTANTVTSFGTVTAGSFNHQGPEVQGGEYSHTLTANEMPKHRHPINEYRGTSANNGTGYIPANSHAEAVQITTDVNGLGNTGGVFTDRFLGTYYNSSFIGFVGGDSSHNNLPPYITVYMWKRTA